MGYRDLVVRVYGFGFRWVQGSGFWASIAGSLVFVSIPTNPKSCQRTSLKNGRASVLAKPPKSGRSSYI